MRVQSTGDISSLAKTCGRYHLTVEYKEYRCKTKQEINRVKVNILSVF